MPNFDALRSAIIGPLSYLCRAKVKPASLKILIPAQGSLEDLSPYKQTIAASGVLYDSSLTNYKMAYNQMVNYTYDATQNFTIELFGYASGLANPAFSLGGMYLGWFSAGVGTHLMDNGGNQLITSNSTSGVKHLAFVKSGSTLYMYKDGSRVGSTSSLPTGIFTMQNTNFRWYNLRIIQKALTTGETFPVPSAPYTGYEEL